jgi:hypothetical protein
VYDVKSHLTAVLGIALALSAGPVVPGPTALSEAPGSTAAEFEALLQSLARAWSEQNTPAALACFAADALYMQPPDEQLYRGRDDLRVLFDGLRAGTLMQFHNIAFRPEFQVGFGEFTFGRRGSPQAVHGVVVVRVSGGRIASWREYFVPGPASFSDFVGVEGKTWKWTAKTVR